MQPTSSTVPSFMIQTLPSLLRFQRARYPQGSSSMSQALG